MKASVRRRMTAMSWHSRKDGLSMPNNPSEDEIRTRSYLLWEREGRQDGKSEEYWLRAKAELEAELEAKWHAASMEGESTTFVLPVLPISTPPARSATLPCGTTSPCQATPDQARGLPAPAGRAARGARSA